MKNLQPKICFTIKQHHFTDIIEKSEEKKIEVQKTQKLKLNRNIFHKQGHIKP